MAFGAGRTSVVTGLIMPSKCLKYPFCSCGSCRAMAACARTLVCTWTLKMCYFRAQSIGRSLSLSAPCLRKRCHHSWGIALMLIPSVSKLHIHYIAKSIHSPIQIIEIRCSNHFHGHRCTYACRLFLQTVVKEWVALRSSVNPPRPLAPKYSTVNCQWCYSKVEVIGNDSNSATKSQAM